MSDFARRVFFPYCLKRLDDGRFIVLNRLYKPIGEQSRDHVVYETHSTVTEMKITPAIARKLSWSGNGMTEEGFIMLYRDGDLASNRGAYLERLSLLMDVAVG
ncbi:hypothetical protein GCM10007242_45290 [Pigmentiphaga litoralis]|uniref:hypothetical protein n=1 Tax=Pigmentiphaga litoralis TaxID=516702 RepID=UPI00167258AE|nr:hypothetical protein [Pigmentiphaga litoralis]GGX33146.1 hypothetical protein GCM10007242_45290 [Pigmentiphaga litoralis]